MFGSTAILLLFCYKTVHFFDLLVVLSLHICKVGLVDFYALRVAYHLLFAFKMIQKLPLVNSAEVKNYLAVVPREFFELVVCGEHYNNVGLLKRFLVVGKLELFVFLDIGLYNENVGVVAHLYNLAHDCL